MGALSKMAAKMTRFSKWEFLIKKLAVLASGIGFVFCGHFCTIHFVQEKKNKTKKNKKKKQQQQQQQKKKHLIS